MRRMILGVLVGAALLTGCSKKEAAAEAPAPVAEKPAQDASMEPMVQAALDDINKKIQAQQYDAAVGAIVSVGAMPKDPQQQAAFMTEVSRANRALAEREAQGDQNARQSRQMLGRFLTGR